MKTVGSRAEVWHGTAKKTSGGLLKKDLKKNKRGRIVSKKMSNRAKKEKRLEKAGYKTKKGKFTLFKAKKRGGMNINNNHNNSPNEEEVEIEDVKYVEPVKEYKWELPKNNFKPISLQNKATRGIHGKTILNFLNTKNKAALVEAFEAGHGRKNLTNSLIKQAKKNLSDRKNKYLNNLISDHGSMDKALIEAVSKGKIGTVRILLDAGVNPNGKDKFGYTLLYLAASKGHTDIVKLLLERGADFEEKTNAGETPLHIAALRGETDILKLLLDAGADKEVTDYDGMTPMHHAAIWGITDIMKLLLDAGADKDTKNRKGKTPMDLVIKWAPEVRGTRHPRNNSIKLLESYNLKGGSKKRRKRKTTKRKSKK